MGQHGEHAVAVLNDGTGQQHAGKGVSPIILVFSKHEPLPAGRYFSFRKIIYRCAFGETFLPIIGNIGVHPPRPEVSGSKESIVGDLDPFGSRV